MSNDKNWNQIFNNIVKDIDVNISECDLLSSWEIQRAIAGANETATYLGRFLLEQMHHPDITLHKKATPYVRQLISLTNTLSEILAMCECPECAAALDECWCTEDSICDNCLLDEGEL